MSDLHFDNPFAVNFIWPILGIALVLVWLELRSRRSIDRFLSRAMQSRLVRQTSLGRRLASILLFASALVAFTFALMRPQWGFTYRSLPRVGAMIMVCLDVSRSMLAEDAKPNRLERAKAELNDMLSFLDGDQVGLTAFAGNATVLCPMTSDYGFLRLVLRDVGTHSAGRGGTRLSEPIRKAVSGFGEAADVSRVMILITDGGDQDSYPLDAAREARERGIKIITIGFGDEAGSQIELTNPETGATDVIRDANGQPVISRLDGDLLRRIALETEGAYIPAGTGALDLEAIYREHIEGLIRGDVKESEQIVRSEIFQIPILIGLGLLLASVGLRGGSLRANSGVANTVKTLRAASVVVGLSMGVTLGHPAKADTTPGSSAKAATPPSASADPKEGSAESEKQVATGSPRARYNESLALWDADLDKIESLLQSARQDAGSDGELRFRASFNLGWVFVKRADAVMKSQPQQAVEHLRQAADWFQRAVRIRPEDSDARFNLEIVQRRLLEITDSLRKSDDDLAKVLDQLIGAQRSLRAEVGAIVERIRQLDQVDPGIERFREDFRRLATRQRQILSDAQKAFEAASAELTSLSQKPADQLTDQERQRMAQLTFGTRHLEQATQRMGQSRQQLRLREDQRAFRRQSASLDMLKQARDVFRNLDERVRALLGDSFELHRYTQLVGNAKSGTPTDPTAASSFPAWLTKELVDQTQEAISDRTREFVELLKFAVSPGSSDEQRQPAKNEPPSAEPPPREMTELLPLVSTAAERFQSAQQSLQADQILEAAQFQWQAIEALSEAAEQLLDLKGMIELTYTTEQQLRDILAESRPSTQDETRRILGSSVKIQERNLPRAGRLKELIAMELEALSAGERADGGKPSDAEAAEDAEQKASVEQQKAGLGHADRLVDRIDESMRQALNSLQATDPGKVPVAAASGNLVGKAWDFLWRSRSQPKRTNPPVGPSGVAASSDTAEADRKDQGPFAGQTLDHVNQAVADLQELRRMFLSVVDRLRENAEQQSDLNDATQELASVTDPEETDRRQGQLSDRQRQLHESAERIQNDLTELAKSGESVRPANPSGSPPDQAEQENVASPFEQAAGLVGKAVEQMEHAESGLRRTSDIELAAVRKTQDQALQHLIDALNLFSSPNQSGDSKSSEESNEGESGLGDDQQPSAQERNQQGSSQLLQMIRDREAQRRRENARRARRASAPVETDW